MFVFVFFRMIFICVYFFLDIYRQGMDMMYIFDLYFWNWLIICCVDVRLVYGIYFCIVFIGFFLFVGYMRMMRLFVWKQVVLKEEQNEGCGELKFFLKFKYLGEVCLQ